jgi:hypothetical protein
MPDNDRAAQQGRLSMLLLFLTLLTGTASAANCPYCNHQYPEPAPWKGEKERVQALRAAHEKVCQEQRKKSPEEPQKQPAKPEEKTDPRFSETGKQRAKDTADFQRGGDSLVLKAARGYADGGGYVSPPWKGHGVPEAVKLRDDDQTPIRWPNRDKRTYCCGFTFAVVMKVARNKGLLDGKPRAAVQRFATEWYGANATSAEKQCVLAMEKLGIGEEVEPEVRDIRQKTLHPGDFVMFWRRNGSGHSVVFLDWAREPKGKVVGMKYRSSQSGTNGIGDAVEYFESPPGRSRTGVINPLRTYAGRLHRPDSLR